VCVVGGRIIDLNQVPVAIDKVGEVTGLLLRRRHRAIGGVLVVLLVPFLGVVEEGLVAPI